MSQGDASLMVGGLVLDTAGYRAVVIPQGWCWPAVMWGLGRGVPGLVSSH